MREDVLQRATDRNWIQAATEDSVSSMSRLLHRLSYQGTLVLFFYEGVLFLFALLFFILCMRTDFNAFYELFFNSIFITLFPSLFLLLLRGGDFFYILDSFTILYFYLMYVLCHFFVKHLVHAIILVWKHMELHFLYERCYTKQFIIGLFTRKCHWAPFI